MMTDEDEMSEFEVVSTSFQSFADEELVKDLIAPVEIEHLIEEIAGGHQDKSEHYNFLLYHFEEENAYSWARAYLTNPNEVSIAGPFANRNSMEPIDAPEFFEKVLVYLKRRYLLVEALNQDGYKALWRHPHY